MGRERWRRCSLATSRSCRRPLTRLSTTGLLEWRQAQRPIAICGHAQQPGHANVHMGPTTVNEVLVLAPKGTVLPVLARRGEWVQVGLSPALRKTGMVMRWYKNENNGWIHDSMLEVVKPGEK